MKIYVDSCLVIYFVEQVEPFFSRLSSLSSPNFELHVSGLVKMEATRLPLARAEASLLDLYDSFFEECNLVETSRMTYEIAARMCADSSTKTIDALHVAHAIESGCDEFWTNDLRLSKVTSRIKIRVPF